jgi:hypothetical protein
MLIDTLVYLNLLVLKIKEEAVAARVRKIKTVVE